MYSSFLGGRAVWSQDEFLGSGRKLGKTSDRQVFVIQIRIFPQNFIGLAVMSSVDLKNFATIRD
jgi:hypothetical protein